MINQALKSYIAASILTIMVVQLNSVIDSIVVGHFVNPDALAAITLSAPVMTLIVSLYILLAGGAALLAGKKIGERNYEQASRIFSVSMNSLLTIALLVSGLCVYFCQDIVALYCDDARLLPYVSQYMSVGFACLIFSMFAQSMSQFTNVDGKPQVVARSMLCCVVANIVFDILFVAVLGVGVGGSAVASALGYAVCILLLFPYTFGKKSSYRYTMAVPQAAAILKENVKNGVIMLLMILFGAIATFVINSIILSTQGADGMFIVSIAGALMAIGALFASGTSQAFVAIGSMLLGQKDYRGVRMLFVRCLSIIAVVSVVITVIGILKPDLFALLFGAKSETLIANAQVGVRIIVMMLIPFLIVNMMPAVYQVLGHLKLVNVVSFSFYGILVLALWILSRSVAPYHIWYAYPIAGWSCIILTVIVVSIYQRKLSKIQRFTLIPTLDSDMELLELSMPCSAEGVKAALDELKAFFTAHPLGTEQSDECCGAVKEILDNIVVHSGLSEQCLVDVRSFYENQQLIVVIKDNGKPFDPTRPAYQKAGLSRVSAHTAKFEYKYMFKQNMTFLTFQI